MVPLVMLLATALAQAPSGALEGEVATADGKPLAGAKVWLSGLKDGWKAPVVGRAETDGAGRFAIPRPEGLAGGGGDVVPSLWVASPGMRVVRIRYDGPLPRAREKITLAPARKKAGFRVLKPDGSPSAGARVRVIRLYGGYEPVPVEVAEVTERSADDRGAVVLDAFASEDPAHFEIRAEGFGVQAPGYFADAVTPGTITLRRTGSVSGRLMAEDPAVLKGWKVSLSTYPQEPQVPGSYFGSWAESGVDGQGRFTANAIAAGALTVNVDWPGETDYLPAFSGPYRVVAGRETEIEIPVKKGILVSGLVRERKTGLPVAGAKVAVTRAGEDSVTLVDTDKDGRYTFRSLPGKGQVGLNSVPPSHASWPWRQEDVVIPDGVPVFEIAAKEVPAAAPAIRGRAIDEAGRPVPGAKIEGQWSVSEDGRELQTRLLAASVGEDGTFTLGGIHPGASGAVSARAKGLAAAPVPFRAGMTEELTITLTAQDVTSVAGRVIDPKGRPVDGAAIKIYRRRNQTAASGSHEWGVFQPEDGRAIRSGSDGEYATSKDLLRPDREFQVEAVAAGHFPNKTNWTAAGSGDTARMPDLVLREIPRVRAVTGRVVDRQGRPVAQAFVFQTGDGPLKTEATTDDEGRFRLPGVDTGGAIILARKDGFRLGGAVARDDAGVEVRLARQDEPPVRALRTLPAPLSRAEERARGLKLLAPAIPRARSGDSGGLGPRIGPALARLDPARGLDMIEDRVIDRPDEALLQAALGQYEDSPQVALATVEADRSPAVRSQALLAMVHVEADPARRIALVDRALGEIRKMDDSPAKLARLDGIARWFLDAGAIDRASPLLREGQAMIGGFKMWAYEGESFAEALGVIDLPAARKILSREGFSVVSPTDARQVAGHLAEVAARIGQVDPAEAERLIGEFAKDFYPRQRIVIRAAGAMARKDLNRARKLLTLIPDPRDSGSRPQPWAEFYGLGCLASVVAASDPKAAAGMLDEAYAGLTRVAEQNPMMVTGLMAALLPVSERVEPDRLDERIWLLASTRAPRGEKEDAWRVGYVAAVALMVSRYDRDAASVILAPVVAMLPELAAGEAGLSANGTDLVALLVAIDPGLIEDLIAGLPASARKVTRDVNAHEYPGVELSVRVRAAEMLGLPPSLRRREALSHAQMDQAPVPE